MAMPDQTKQRGAAGRRESGGLQHNIELRGLLAQFFARHVRPPLIVERNAAGEQRGAGADPRPHRLANARDHLSRTDREAEPQSGKAIELSERPQDHDRPTPTQGNRADRGIEIGEGFVDHDNAAARRDSLRNTGQRGVIDDMAIGIVRIDDGDVTNSFRQLVDRPDGNDLMPRQSPRGGVLVVGGRENGDTVARNEARQPLDQRLRPGRGDDAHIIRHRIGTARRGEQCAFIGTRRQTLPHITGQWRNRIGIRIDTGGQIEPRRRSTAKLRDCLAEIATVFHAPLMARYDVMREKLSPFIVGLVVLTLGAATAPAHAAELPRIASINACTDQLLLALADPEQILGLGPYSRDATRSWSAAAARRYPRLSGNAEDVLVLKPDVVVAGSFTKRATRELLKEQGQQVITFDVAHSLDEVKAQIRKMGEVTKHPDRAETYVTQIDAALSRARQFTARKRYRVLSISRRGWVSGSRSLMSSLTAEIGLSNAAGELGLKLGGFASLESIVKLQPDFIVVSNDSNFAEDEGRAFLLHPALEHFYPPAKRLVVPERLTVCGGPMVADALDRIVSEITRAERETGTTSAAR